MVQLQKLNKAQKYHWKKIEFFYRILQAFLQKLQSLIDILLKLTDFIKFSSIFN